MPSLPPHYTSCLPMTSKLCPWKLCGLHRFVCAYNNVKRYASLTCLDNKTYQLSLAPWSVEHKLSACINCSWCQAWFNVCKLACNVGVIIKGKPIKSICLPVHLSGSINCSAWKRQPFWCSSPQAQAQFNLNTRLLCCCYVMTSRAIALYYSNLPPPPNTDTQLAMLFFSYDRIKRLKFKRTLVNVLVMCSIFFKTSKTPMCQTT